jgi:anti-sigma-K factor RskA
LEEVVMNRIPCIRRFARVLAGLAVTLLAFAAAAPALAAPAARAIRVPPPGGTTGSLPVVVHARTIVQGGMPGWQIALIAAGAALAAATAAVFADRKLAGRRTVTATTA